ncbi:MAG: hypothetical protein COS15_01035 [Caldiserica bacterium CG02_land_8_20_14_3_00_36_38]|nr:MAG: hypothetical protein COS15_01035 [Caldiserica bacterium CG02_land_8_20_14_3_00_36_38]
MVRTKLLFLLIFVLVFTWISVPVVMSYSEISVEISNNLSFPLEKSVQFSVELPGFKVSNNISVNGGPAKLPVEIVKVENNIVTLKSLLEFKASEKKRLMVRYGDDISKEYTKIFKPDFIGNYFIGFGSDNLYIVSMATQNSVKISDSKGKVLLDKTLGLNETADLILGKDQTFEIRSDKPVFAELSSLKLDYVSNSSDDTTSVYGSYFTIFIPKEIFVSAYKNTHIKIQNLKGEVVFDGDLPERGVYSNLSLKPDFYTIETDVPVSIQFGYSDDNIYTIFYGNLNSFKGVSFGDIIYSSLYPDTTVTFKTKDKIYDSENLKTPGDYSLKEVVKEFSEETTEYEFVYIKFSAPVFIYSNSSSGNTGGEQIPSIDGSGKTFVFRTGKIYNFESINHKRKVVVVAENDNTNVSFNGKNLILNSLESYSENLANSFSLVKIESDKPIAVFETGIDSDLECLSVLLPILDEYSISPVTIVKSSGNESVQTELPALMKKIKEFFGKMGQGIISLKFYDGLKNFWQKILSLLMPVSQSLKPYLSNYFPSLTVEMLSVIIFYIILFIVIIILLFAFKPRKRKTVPKVTIEEISGRPVSFNIDTLEEKEAILVEEEKPRIMKLSETEKQAPVKTDKGVSALKEQEKQKPEEITITEKQFGRKFARFRSKEVKKISLPEGLTKTPGQVEEIPQKIEEKAEKPLKEKRIEKEKPVTEELKPIESVEQKAEQVPAISEEEKKKAEEMEKEKVEEPLSSIEILLGKLKKEEKPEEKLEQAPEKPVSAPQEIKPVLKKTFEHTFVADAESLNRIFEAIANDENTKKLVISKVFISATEREKINFDINDKYRLGLIALTPIELRIAEDIGKRINAKAGTGEAILIARKIRALDVVVSDRPALTNYQGILINKIEDIV